MQDSMNDGWVTFQKLQLPGGLVIVVQKRDGSTRSFIQPRSTGCRVVRHGDMATNGHINPDRD